MGDGFGACELWLPVELGWRAALTLRQGGVSPLRGCRNGENWP